MLRGVGEDLIVRELDIDIRVREIRVILKD